MSLNPELVLLATMSDRGDYGPLTRGDVSRDSFLTADGKTIHDFIMTYKESTGGVARYPSYQIIRRRFSNTGILLPEPDANVDLDALVYEVKLESVRAKLREISTTCDALAESVDPVEGIGEVIKALQDSHQNVMSSQHMSLGTDITPILEDYACGNILPQGIPWPWPALTRVTHGIQRKEFVVFGGRPKNRKTFVANFVGVHAFLNSHSRVLFLTPEMHPRQILLRSVATAAAVRYTEFKDTALASAEEIRLAELADTYGRIESESEQAYNLRLHNSLQLESGQLPPAFHVVQSTNKPISWIQAQIRIYQPDIVIVDSLYRHRGNYESKNSTETSRVAAVSRGLKELAMEENVAVIATHQINREGDQKVGNLANLSLSDAIGQDLDLGFRAITGTLNGVDHTALVVLGAREVPFKGLLIRNVPCADFSEVSVLDSEKIIHQLMAQEKERDEQEEKADKKKSERIAHQRTASIAASVVAKTGSKLAMKATKKSALSKPEIE